MFLPSCNVLAREIRPEHNQCQARVLRTSHPDPAGYGAYPKLRLSAKMMDVSKSCSIVAILAALLAPCLHLSAQQQPAAGSGKLAAIKVIGSKRFSEAAIASVSGLQPGQQVTREDLQAAADRLGALGWFENVRYRFTSMADSVTLTVELQDAPAVPVSFDNFPWFTDEEMAQALKAAVVLFDRTSPRVGTVPQAMAAALERLLATRDVKSKVEAELVGQVGSDEMMMRFRATEANLKISAVEFGNALAAGDRVVAANAPNLIGKPFSRFALELFAFEHVRPLYLERGHLRVNFPPAQARFTGDPRKPLENSVLAIVPIEPGMVYRWGGITWSGSQALSAEVLDSFVAVPVGLPANGMRVAESWEKVRAEYGRRGYVEAKLAPAAQYDDAPQRVSYRVQVEEGLQYRMGDLVITGLSVLAERKLRAAWPIEPGAIFDRMVLDRFLVDCESKKVFGDYVVHYDEVGHMLRTNGGTRTVDVLIDFK